MPPTPETAFRWAEEGVNALGSKSTDAHRSAVAAESLARIEFARLVLEMKREEREATPVRVFDAPVRATEAGAARLLEGEPE